MKCLIVELHNYLPLAASAFVLFRMAVLALSYSLSIAALSF
nr:MAG TPA: hypothetical protein [Caudoviricetes sp.]DAH97426.1 MAG TPA: hypothetical protein [Bacteriophage sp.]